MPSRDDRPTLFSKMAMFVRNPTKDWSELERQEPEQDGGYDKQALKAMIERKRQNDFVRKREFDNLRKLRRKDPGALASAARPSFFQSSLPADADGRADTLKKIDEIEAQMSKQWWKGKLDAAEATAPPPIPAELTVPVAAADTNSTQAPSLASGFFSGSFAPTQMGVGTAPLLERRRSPRNYGTTSNAALNVVGFSSSDLLSMEPGDVGTDPELEEAAIRFANGDDVGAESALLRAMAGEARSPEVAQVWLIALLDFYRATGQSLAFDRAVLDHAAQLGHLRPRWIDIAGLQTAPTWDPSAQVVRSATAAPLFSPLWSCPAALTAAGLEDLRIALSTGNSPWALDWTQLRTIEDGALPFLADLFASLSTERVDLQFAGSDRLTKALRDLTPAGQQGADDLAWTVRLDALRVMRLQGEFELAALDFCITFEVPPPEWQPVLCHYASVDFDSLVTPERVNDGAVTVPMGLNDAVSAPLELRGQVAGESGAAVKLLRTDYAPGAHVVVSCNALLRVDFSAAGSILNWAATCHSHGCQVQFRDVHRLVAAFFHVIGITEYARVIPLPME